MDTPSFRSPSFEESGSFRDSESSSVSELSESVVALKKSQSCTGTGLARGFKPYKCHEVVWVQCWIVCAVSMFHKSQCHKDCQDFVIEVAWHDNAMVSIKIFIFILDTESDDIIWCRLITVSEIKLDTCQNRRVKTIWMIIAQDKVIAVCICTLSHDF